MGKGDFDNFNFLEQVMPGHEENDTPETEHPDAFVPTDQDFVITSYLLVNTLMNLLVEKGIIKMDEITSLLEELQQSFKEHRGR